MSDNGNGNGESENLGPDQWRNVESDMQKVADPVVRGILIEQLERDREAWQRTERYLNQFSKFRKDVETKFFVLFQNDVAALKTSRRVERKVDDLGAKIDTLITDLRTVGPTVAKVQGEIVTLRDSQTAAMSQASADRLERIALDRRITAAETIVAETRKDVAASGQHLAVVDHVAREALNSVHDKDDEKLAAQEMVLETMKQKHEFKLKTWEKVLAVIGTILVLAASTILAAHYGSQNVHVPTPPAPHEGAHP